jgi:16S rRNA (cytidine1402-2'-O)-methyltransferase
MPATLFVVATPIGNLEDITTRALRVLREAALIAAEDTRRTGHLLARYGIQTPTTSLHEHNERRKTAAIIERLLRGESVALVSDAGTPVISDPGRMLVRAAIEAGVRVEPIPGPNAAIALLAVSGFDTKIFTFLGFPPTRGKDRNTWLQALGSRPGTVVFYEAPHRIRQTLTDVLEQFGDLEAVVGRELTKAHEELVIGPISTILARLEAPKGELTVALDIGHMTKIGLGEASRPIPDDAKLLEEIGGITYNKGLSRRRAIAALAARHGMSSNAVYAAIERARKSGK